MSARQWTEGRGKAMLYVLVAAIVWVSGSSGISSAVAAFNGDNTRATKIAVSACSQIGFYNGHKGDCDVLLTGSASAEGK